MYTYQDFEKDKAVSLPAAIKKAIQQHRETWLYNTAVIADLYDHQRNKTINEYVKMIFEITGEPIEDFTASNNKIASNLFHRLNTQRCTYLLGNGISFPTAKLTKNPDGTFTVEDKTKNALGPDADTVCQRAGYYALIHAVSFLCWNADHLRYFKITEFVPLYDENTGALRAGIRFWQIDEDKPMTAELYEEDGYSYYRTEKGEFVEIQPKRTYKRITRTIPADQSVIGIVEENYDNKLPIVPWWGSDLHQSTLVGMREAIDSYDLIRSGFANDLNDCAQIYWLIENYGAMDDAALARFRDRVKINHIAEVNTMNGGKVTPYTQEIPYQARKEYLDHIRAGIYEDFGGLDVHTIAAGATNDHIDAAYQPLDENADAFEAQVIMAIRQILSVIGIDDTPIFKRNRISNQKEQVEMVILESPYLDTETILHKFPNLTVDEVAQIMERKSVEEASRFENTDTAEEEEKTNVEDTPNE